MINSTNIDYEDEKEEDLNQINPTLKKYYIIFWKNNKYLANPYKLLDAVDKNKKDTSSKKK